MRSRIVFSALAGATVLLFAWQVNLHGTAAAPRNAKQFHFKVPAAGTLLTYRERINGGLSATTHHYLPNSAPYEGRPTYRVAITGTINAYDAKTGNLLARFDRTNGDLLITNKPHSGLFNWPLWVGKRWTSSYAHENHKTGNKWDPVVTDYEVEGIETLSTEAGKFQTLRIFGRGGTNNSFDRTLWFDPERGIYIKIIMEGRTRQGHMRAVTELKAIGKP